MAKMAPTPQEDSTGVLMMPVTQPLFINLLILPMQVAHVYSDPRSGEIWKATLTGTIM
jgi:hypothetical protein